jgi:hypothetical protein
VAGPHRRLGTLLNGVTRGGGSVVGLSVHGNEVFVARLVGEDVGELRDDRLSGSTAEDPVVVEQTVRSSGTSTVVVVMITIITTTTLSGKASALRGAVPEGRASRRAP